MLELGYYYGLAYGFGYCLRYGLGLSAIVLLQYVVREPLILLHFNKMEGYSLYILL